MSMNSSEINDDHNDHLEENVRSSTEMSLNLDNLNENADTNYYLGVIKDLRNEIDLLKSKYESVRIGNEKESSKSKVECKIKYKSEWTWIQKIIYTMIVKDTPLRTASLVDLLESEIGTFYSTDFNKMISYYLNRAVNQGRLSRHKELGTRGYYYCLPKWMENNTLSDTYKAKIEFQF